MRTSERRSKMTAFSDDELRAQAQRYPTRTALNRGAPALAAELKRRGLYEEASPSKRGDQRKGSYIDLPDDVLVSIARRYKNRTSMRYNDPQLVVELNRRGLYERAAPPWGSRARSTRYREASDADLIRAAAKYTSRSELCGADSALAHHLRKRGLYERAAPPRKSREPA